MTDRLVGEERERIPELLALARKGKKRKRRTYGTSERAASEAADAWLAARRDNPPSP